MLGAALDACRRDPAVTLSQSAGSQAAADVITDDMRCIVARADEVKLQRFPLQLFHLMSADVRYQNFLFACCLPAAEHATRIQSSLELVIMSHSCQCAAIIV